jgi:hypothetical protein
MHKQTSAASEEKIFGMSLNEITVAADTLSEQKDSNCPARSGSYQDFLNTLRAGKKLLATQEKYTQRKA